MQAEVRQQRIHDYLQKVEFASLEELAQQVDASTSTVRRDLISLEASGALRRTHGGARIAASRSDESIFSNRNTHQSSEKEIIAKRCAELISENQTVIIEAGTTVFHAARQLENKSLQIVTNSLPVANHFASSQRVEVVVSGGVIYPRLGVLVGPLAVETFSKIHADVAIMSAGGITEEGITNSHGLLIELQKTMMQAAQKVIFCLDSTKFGRRSISYLCDLTHIDTIVTDAGAPRDIVERIRAKGVEVIIANSQPSSDGEALDVTLR